MVVNRLVEYTPHVDYATRTCTSRRHLYLPNTTRGFHGDFTTAKHHHHRQQKRENICSHNKAACDIEAPLAVPYLTRSLGAGLPSPSTPSGRAVMMSAFNHSLTADAERENSFLASPRLLEITDYCLCASTHSPRKSAGLQEETPIHEVRVGG